MQQHIAARGARQKAVLEEGAAKVRISFRMIEYLYT
jgi:hypothetical protein